MGYLHIQNLYRNREILLFRECYALEKVHGTSAHVAWKEGELRFFSGGVKHDSFVALFDEAVLVEHFIATGRDDVIVYGEAYGGKCQGMKDTYGDDLRFIVFDVRMGYAWLNVPDAEQVAQSLGFEFMPYVQNSTDIECLDQRRDQPSVVAMRRGCGDGKKREGVVLRPLIEVTKNNGERIIAKHKREDFQETRTKRKVTADPAQLKVLADAQAIADEWVTEMRLTHVMDALRAQPGANGRLLQPESMGDVIKAMIADVEREAEGEIVASKPARKAIGKRTAAMVMQRMKESVQS